MRALVCLALAVPGCCFMPTPAPTPTTAATTVAAPLVPHVASPTVSLSLPTDPTPSFAGVEGPLPMPGTPFGMPGALARSGSATVTTSSGNLGIPVGTRCAYVQWRTDPAIHGFDCRWNVTCAGYVLYGTNTSGYEYCTRPEWPAGTIMLDEGTEAMNGDALFRWDAAGMSLGDDPSGDLGAWAVTLTPDP